MTAIEFRKVTKMICLVTGGLGFVGSNLVDELVRKGHEVHVWDNLSSESSSYNYANLKVKYTINDVRDINRYIHHPKYDVIFHLAANARIQPSFQNPLEYLSNDIMGTAHICDLARKLGSKVVYAGSSSAYAGPMLNPYSFAKYTGEQVCEMYHRVYGMSTITARFFNVYGPRQPKNGAWATVIGVFENLCLEGKPMTVTGNGEQKRDFTHIDDIVSGFIALSEIEGTGTVVNLGTGVNYTLNSVADMFSKHKVYLPKRPGEAWETLAQIEETKQLINWSPTIKLSDYVLAWKEKNLGCNEGQPSSGDSAASQEQ